MLVQGNGRHGVSPAAVPERRGFREAGAEDGGDAEEDKGADVHCGLPCLLVDIIHVYMYVRINK